MYFLGADRYSYRSVTIGSTRDARQAGSQLARAAAAVIVAAAARNVVVSVGPTPNSKDATSRFKANAPARPRIQPHIVSESPSFMIPESTVERVAPTAMRIPISRRCSVTIEARSPYVPTAERTNASAEKSVNSCASRRGRRIDSAKTTSRLSWFVIKYSSDRGCNTPPFTFLTCKFFTPFPSEAIEPCFTVAVRNPPFRGNKASILETLQRWIKRAVIDDQNVFGLLLDSSGNTLSMLGSKQQCPEDEQIQRALKVSRVFAIGALTYRHSTRVSVNSG